MIAINKVIYSQKFPTGAYLNCDIGFEASIVEGIDDPLEAMTTLQKLAESFHKSSFSHLYTESGSPVTIAQVREDEPIITDPDKAFIETLDYCKSLSMLERFRPQVERKNNPDITTAFENKLQSLKNQ